MHIILSLKAYERYCGILCVSPADDDFDLRTLDVI